MLPAAQTFIPRSVLIVSNQLSDGFHAVVGLAGDGQDILLLRCEGNLGRSTEFLVLLGRLIQNQRLFIFEGHRRHDQSARDNQFEA